MHRKPHQVAELQDDVVTAMVALKVAAAGRTPTASIDCKVLANIIDFANDVLAEIEAMQRAGLFQPQSTTKDIGHA